MLKIMEKSPNLLRKKIVLILTMSSQVPHTALTCSFTGSSHKSKNFPYQKRLGNSMSFVPGTWQYFQELKTL